MMRRTRALALIARRKDGVEWSGGYEARGGALRRACRPAQCERDRTHPPRRRLELTARLSAKCFALMACAIMSALPFV